MNTPMYKREIKFRDAVAAEIHRRFHERSQSEGAHACELSTEAREKAAARFVARGVVEVITVMGIPVAVAFGGVGHELSAALRDLPRAGRYPSADNQPLGRRDMNVSTDQCWTENYPAALAQVRDLLAQGAELNLGTCLKAAQPFGLHMGATFVEFVGYIERETGREVTR